MYELKCVYCGYVELRKDAFKPEYHGDPKKKPSSVIRCPKCNCHFNIRPID